MTVDLLRNADGSAVLSLTADLLRALSLSNASCAEISVQDGQLILCAEGHIPHAARRRPKYTMEELLAHYDQIPKDPEEEFDWLNSPPVGRELI
jgi:antitoxin ChpS